jgi:hypothetical protein
MRRRHVRQAGIARPPGARLDREALGIHRDRDNTHPRTEQRAARPRVARLLHPDAIARIEQQAADQLEALLGAGHDQHLLGAEAGAAGGLHVLGDGLAQRAKTRRLAVVELARRDRTHPPAREPPPERHREQVHPGRSDAEGARRAREALGALGRRHQGGSAPRQGRVRQAGGRPGNPAAQEIVRQLVGHEGAGAPAPGEVPLRLELLHREQRGRPGHPEVVGQGARRGQARPGPHDAVQDRPLDARIDLALEPAAMAGIEADQKARRALRGGHT